jgi:sugar lactone lactonase YvrE
MLPLRLASKFKYGAGAVLLCLAGLPALANPYYKLTPIGEFTDQYEVLFQYKYTMDATGQVYFGQDTPGTGGGFLDIYKGNGTQPPSVVYLSPPEVAGQTQAGVYGGIDFLGINSLGQFSFFGEVNLPAGDGGYSPIGAFVLNPGATIPQPLGTSELSGHSGSQAPGFNSALNNAGAVAMLVPWGYDGLRGCYAVQPAIVGPGSSQNLPDPAHYCLGNNYQFIPLAINNLGDSLFAINAFTSYPNSVPVLNFYTSRNTPSNVNGSVINNAALNNALGASANFNNSDYGPDSVVLSSPTLNDLDVAALIVANAGQWTLYTIGFNPAMQSLTPQVLVQDGSVTGPYGGVLCNTPAINNNNEILFIGGSSPNVADGGIGGCGKALFVVDPSAVEGYEPRAVVSVGDTFVDSAGATWTINSVGYTSQQSINLSGSIAIVVTATSPGMGGGNFIVRADPVPGLSPGNPLQPSGGGNGTQNWTVVVPQNLAPTCVPSCLSTWHAFIDPPIAAGYAYSAGAGAPNFADVYIPAPLAHGQSNFTLQFNDASGNSLSKPVQAGTPFLFTTYVPGGVSTFSIVGINDSEALDATNPSAFVAGVSFVSALTADAEISVRALADTGPTISPTVSGTQGNNGWYTSNVTVNWSVIDPLGVITNQTGCGAIQISSDTTGQTVTCAATSAGGTATQSVTIKRDATLPVAIATPSPLPNASGWNNTTVTVSFSGSDATSGIANCSAPVAVSSQGANQSSAPGTCTDNAGNVSAPVAASGINIEETPPQIGDMILSSVPESATGWYTTPVTVSFAGTDTLSGVAPSGCSGPITLSSSGAGQSVTGTCTNVAGDLGSLAVSAINIDLTTPIASYTASPPPNANGWNNTPVTVSFSGTDSLNGSGIASCTAPITVSTAGAGQLATGSCTSVAGTSSATVTDTININLTAPTILITTPPNNGGYPVGAGLIANYACTDALSGTVASACSGTVANGSLIDTASPGLKTFAVTATDVAGNSATLSSTYLISTLTLTTPGSIWTLAGTGMGTFSGDGGLAINAGIQGPHGIATDTAGNVYISDYNNQRIRKVATDGTITTVAGNGTLGFSGDGGPATDAQLYVPSGIAVDPAGNIVFADTNNNRVRRIATDGTITTVAGNGSSGYSGDGGPALNAALSVPNGIAIDALGNIYIADLNNNRIRKVGTDGNISTVAGNGAPGFSGDGAAATSAELNSPVGVAIDALGNLYIADTLNQRVRKVGADGTISTVAGNGTAGFSGDGGAATSAQFLSPYGVAVDAGGNLYVADTNNNVIRKVSIAGTISTVAGMGVPGFSGDGGMATSAELNAPLGIAVATSGNLYISDNNNERIRWVPGLGTTDSAPPLIAPTLSGTLGTNGWYTSNVTVTWSVNDPLAPIISQTGCGTTTINTDTLGQVVTCTAVGQGGTTTKSVTIKRDATPPVAFATPAPLPNSNGWNNTTVSVTFAGTDSMSGIASCTAPTAVATQGAGQTSAAGTCTDNAGNVSTPVSATNINIDEAPPIVSGSATPPANANGWRNSPVTVTFTATDSLSGVAVNACGAPVVLTTNGAGQSVTGSCSDKAGNVATASVPGISIDTIAPTIMATATPAANVAGWNNSPVTVAFSGTDNLSGSGIAGCTPSIVVSNPGSGILASGTCTDRAGNSSAPGTYLVNLDEAPPTVTIATPANGASYALGSVVNAAYSCVDGLSGVAACAGTVASGGPIDTSSVGTKTFNVNAADVAGNIAASTVSYTVAPASVAFTLTPNALNFGNQAEHSSTELPITLTSTGTGAVPITQIAVAGGNAGQFSETHTCGATVPAGTSCVITVAFNPTSLGAKTSSLIVKAAGHVAEESVSLTGTAVAPTFSVTPAAVVFGNQAKGVSSAPLTVTITNTGGIVLPLTKINLGGANAGQFAITPSDQTGQVLCGTTLPAGAECNIDIVFTPTSTGAKIATLKVTAGGGGISQTINLSGTGIIPTYSLAPTTLNFGNQAHATRSAPLPIVLTNTGSLALPITEIAATGQFSQTNTCGASVSPGSACTIEVIFAPTSRGSKTGTLRVTAGGGAAAMTAALVGNGT